MVENDNNTVRAIAWSEVFPWLKLVRVFRLAISAKVLVLAALALLITATGWGAIGMIFGIDSLATGWLDPYATCSWKATTDGIPNHPALPLDRARVLDVQPGSGLVAAAPWAMLTRPALQGLTQTGFSLRGVASVLLCGLLSVAIWAFFGAAICRIAAVQLAADEQVGVGAALRFACRKWLSYCAAPLLPVGGVLLASIPVAILGLIMKANVGLLLGGLLWPLALVAGLFMALLLLGVLFGWPLMWATISTEGTDSFDALSRSYAYTFQRPLHYLFYAFVAGVIGWLGWLLVQNFAAGVIWMGYWAAGWGCGSERVSAIMSGQDMSGTARIGAGLIRFWAECVKLLAVGYLFSYFFSAAAGIYLLLRRDVDATEMDEVYLDADKSEESFGLPEVTTDAAGAPVAES